MAVQVDIHSEITEGIRMLAKLRKVAQLFKRREQVSMPARSSTRAYGFADFRHQKRLSRFSRI
jgi:hypothetical protein